MRYPIYDSRKSENRKSKFFGIYPPPVDYQLVTSFCAKTRKHALKAQYNLAQWQRLGFEMRTKQNCALKGQHISNKHISNFMLGLQPAILQHYLFYTQGVAIGLKYLWLSANHFLLSPH